MTVDKQDPSWQPPHRLFLLLGASAGLHRHTMQVFTVSCRKRALATQQKHTMLSGSHTNTQEYSFLITADILTCHRRRSTDGSCWLCSISFRQIQGQHAGSLKWNTTDTKMRLGWFLTESLLAGLCYMLPCSSQEMTPDENISMIPAFFPRESTKMWEKRSISQRDEAFIDPPLVLDPCQNAVDSHLARSPLSKRDS